MTVIRYTVIFTGTPILTAEPDAEPDAVKEKQGGSEMLILMAAALAALCVGAGGTYFLDETKGAHVP